MNDIQFTTYARFANIVQFILKIPLGYEPDQIESNQVSLNTKTLVKKVTMQKALVIVNKLLDKKIGRHGDDNEKCHLFPETNSFGNQSTNNT